MKRPLRKIDYVTKDYEGFRQMMVDLIPIYTPEWTDTSQSDFGIVLIELFAHGLDILSYYQDKAVNENLMSTATLRSSVERLGRFLGYEPYTQTPSKVMVTFKKYDDLINEKVIIPRGTKVSTKDEEIIFETEEDLIIPEEVLSKEVSCVQGETVTDELLGVSSGEPNQIFRLAQDNVIDTTVELYIADTENSIENWDEVKNFLNSSMSNNHYIVERRGDFSYITFGSGKTSRIPPINSKIYVKYRIGGGIIGNVGVKTITELYDDFIDGIEEVYNEEIPYEQGKDIEDTERIRYLAPKVFSMNDRAVTKWDFEALAESIIGVYRAKGEEFAGENKDEFHLHIVSETFGELTPELKNAIEELIEEKRLVTPVKIEVKQANFVDISLELDLTVKEGYNRNEVVEELKSLIEYHFSNDGMEFGENIELMDLLSLGLEVHGIKALNLTPTCELPEIGEYEMARIVDININAIGGVVDE